MKLMIFINQKSVIRERFGHQWSSTDLALICLEETPISHCMEAVSGLWRCSCFHLWLQWFSSGSQIWVSTNRQKRHKLSSVCCLKGFTHIYWRAIQRVRNQHIFKRTWWIADETRIWMKRVNRNSFILFILSIYLKQRTPHSKKLNIKNTEALYAVTNVVNKTIK